MQTGLSLLQICGQDLGFGEFGAEPIPFGCCGVKCSLGACLTAGEVCDLLVMLASTAARSPRSPAGSSRSAVTATSVASARTWAFSALTTTWRSCAMASA